jgi:quinol monooxygenase YgiN
VKPGRRQVLAGAAALAAIGPQGAMAMEESQLYGLIGKLRAMAGKRADLAAILLAGTGAMPGCLSYIIAEDLADPDALWITEVWDKEESHKASLKLPAVQAAIARGRPLIAGFDSHTVTRPLGGFGMPG